MFKVKIDTQRIVDELYTEEALSELSVMESIYIMRRVKAIVHYGESEIEVESGKINSYNQVFF